MNTVILSRQRKSLAPFESWLGDVTKDAILFCDERRASSYSCFKQIIPFSDYETNGNVEFEVIQLSKKWPIDRIVATSEMDILRAGRLRTYLGIPGQSYSSAIAFRNKVQMKTIVNRIATSFKVPKFRAISEPWDVIEFIEENGLPVILKPVDGAGAEKTTILRTMTELHKLLQGGIGHNLEIESFISGDLYHIDGLVVNGEVIFSWPSKYAGSYFSSDKSNEWQNQGGFTGSYMLSSKNSLVPRLQAVAEEVLSALPTPKNTSFHLEVFHTPNDEIVFCEIGSRTGGALVNPTIELAFGINLTKQFVRTQAGLSPDFELVAKKPNSLFGWALCPPQSGVLTDMTANSPTYSWLRHFEWTGERGKRYSGPSNAVDQVANLIVEFDDEQLGMKKLTDMVEWVTRHTSWKI